MLKDHAKSKLNPKRIYFPPYREDNKTITTIVQYERHIYLYFGPSCHCVYDYPCTRSRLARKSPARRPWCSCLTPCAVSPRPRTASSVPPLLRPRPHLLRRPLPATVVAGRENAANHTPVSPPPPSSSNARPAATTGASASGFPPRRMGPFLPSKPTRDIHAS